MKPSFHFAYQQIRLIGQKEVGATEFGEADFCFWEEGIGKRGRRRDAEESALVLFRFKDSCCSHHIK